MRGGRKEILVAGMALVIAGIILAVFSLENLQEGSYSLTTIDTLSPGASVNEDINMTLVYRYNEPGVNMSLAVDSEPSDVPMKAQVMQPGDGAKIVDTDFTDELFATFSPTINGQYNITISNLGTQEPVSLTIETGTTSFLSSGNGSIIIQRNVSFAAFMVFVGFIVLIYGGIVLPIKEMREARRRGGAAATQPPPTLPYGQAQQQKRARPAGLRVYALLTGVAGLFTIIIISDFINVLIEEESLLLLQQQQQQQQPAISGDDSNENVLLVLLLLSIAPVIITITMVTNGITYLVIMAGLLYFAKSWIWRVAVIMSFISIALSLTSSVVAVILADYYYEYQYLVTIANVIINGTLLYYLYRPYVKIYFGRSTTATSASATG